MNACKVEFGSRNPETNNNFDKRRAAVHEGGHLIVSAHFGIFGGTYIQETESGWIGQIRNVRILDAQTLDKFQEVAGSPEVSLTIQCAGYAAEDVFFGSPARVDFAKTNFEIPPELLTFAFNFAIDIIRKRRQLLNWIVGRLVENSAISGPAVEDRFESETDRDFQQRLAGIDPIIRKGLARKFYVHTENPKISTVLSSRARDAVGRGGELHNVDGHLRMAHGIAMGSKPDVTCKGVERLMGLPSGYFVDFIGALGFDPSTGDDLDNRKKSKLLRKYKDQKKKRGRRPKS